MKADLYIRVSTDEQAEKGYSQRDQEERLRKYCDFKKIAIRRVIYEDYSAKTFLRPEWKLMLEDYKKRKGQLNYILFTKWDRFSRNAADAFQMINTLRKLGIEPIAIEQPLDLDVPENKIMLGIYLTAPEVENDRRSLNVTYGMRRAVKEGRWMNGAPLGYINRITETGKKYIAIEQPFANILKWSFETLSHGDLTVESVYREAHIKGLKCSKQQFWNLMRNPVYCGKIFLKGYKDEAASIVKGNHEPIITETLFYDVQDVLEGKKRKKYRTALGGRTEFVLRGYLICPRCGRLLTSSASRGRSQVYYYYHCNAKCGARFKSETVNALFSKELKKYVPKPGMVEVYAEIINQSYKLISTEQDVLLKEWTSKLDLLNSYLQKARHKFMTDQISRHEYNEFKIDTEKEVQRLETNLFETSGKAERIDKILNKAICNLADLSNIYEESDTKRRRKIIGSIYPEKLVFDGVSFRTARFNEAVSLIFNVDASFSQNKNGQTEEKIDLSTSVARPGFEPRQTVPKTVVLPLYYQAIRSIGSQNYWDGLQK